MFLIAGNPSFEICMRRYIRTAQNRIRTVSRVCCLQLICACEPAPLIFMFDLHDDFMMSSCWLHVVFLLFQCWLQVVCMQYVMCVAYDCVPLSCDIHLLSYDCIRLPYDSILISGAWKLRNTLHTASYGRIRFPMTSFGVLWFHMVSFHDMLCSDDFMWFPMMSYCFLWVNMVSLRCHIVPTMSYGVPI